MQAFRGIRTCISTAKQFTVFANSAFEVPSTRWWSSSSRNDEEEWNEAWESTWLPKDLTPKTRAPWEANVNFPSSSSSTVAAADSETKAFVEERRKRTKEKVEQNGALYSVENMKRDYRLKNQRVHAGLWVKDIEKMEEAKLGDGDVAVTGGDIERLLDSCSEHVPLLFLWDVFVEMPIVTFSVSIENYS